MTQPSTTIRVSTRQRDRLRDLARQRQTTMSATLDDALESLRREQFYAAMASAEQTLRDQPDEWAAYVAQRDAWLEPDLSST
jgi:predicted transcriptional regulator